MTTTANSARLLMNRHQLDTMKLEQNLPVPGAGDGEVVLRLNRFALTTNNITYAAFGDAMKYWAFFPVEDADWGQMPVWGYADVVDSTLSDIDIGQRYFGYFPTATHLVVRPDKITRVSFRDGANHRQPLPEIYNWYQRTDGDRFHDAETEPLQAIYRPLFITAFSLADFLQDNDFFGARRVIISSASSKTAYATAFCIKQSASIECIGLTSAANIEFVEKTGLYDQACQYDAMERLHNDIPTLYIDIAGNPPLRHQLHQHLGDALRYDCTVGSAQSTEPPEPPDGLPGPRPKFFFAPEQIAKRHHDWGVAEFNRRAGEATLSFYQYVTRPDAPLLHITHSIGFEAVQDIIGDLLEGKIDPAEGHVIRL